MKFYLNLDVVVVVVDVVDGRVDGGRRVEVRVWLDLLLMTFLHLD